MKEARDAPTHLFVYGLLRPRLGHRMGQLLRARATYVGKGTMPGRLYDLGGYPGAVPGPVGGGTVKGDIYRLRRYLGLLAWLDAFEGCGPEDPEPRAYERQAVEVWLAGNGPRRAWTYVYRGDASGLYRVAGGDYAAHRLRRPRRVLK